MKTKAAVKYPLNRHASAPSMFAEATLGPQEPVTDEDQEERRHDRRKTQRSKQL